MNGRSHLRDAHLQRALEYAPDANIRPNGETRDAIARAARQAIKSRPGCRLSGLSSAAVAATSWFTGLAATAAVAMIVLRYAPAPLAPAPDQLAQAPAETAATGSAPAAATPSRATGTDAAGPLLRITPPANTAKNLSDSVLETSRSLATVNPPAPLQQTPSLFSADDADASPAPLDLPQAAVAATAAAISTPAEKWTSLRFGAAPGRRSARLQRDDAGEIPALLRTLFHPAPTPSPPASPAGKNVSANDGALPALTLELYGDAVLLGRLEINAAGWSFILPDESIALVGTTDAGILKKLALAQKRLSPAE